MNKDTKTADKPPSNNNLRRTQTFKKRSTYKYANNFKGETPEMKGKVFRLLSKQPTKRRQFEETLEALQRYPDKMYPLDSIFLLTFFSDQERSEVTEPEKPLPKVYVKGGSPHYQPNLLKTTCNMVNYGWLKEILRRIFSLKLLAILQFY